MAICSQEACLRRARARGLCTTHYQAALRAKIPMPKIKPRGELVRYDIQVSTETDETIRSAAMKADEPRARVAARWLEESAKRRR